MEQRFSFSTCWGPVTLVFDHPWLLEVHLPPESPSDEVRQPGPTSELPAFPSDVVGRIRRTLAGEVEDFRDVPVACTQGPSFAAAVYRRLREVPCGATLSYAELARQAGSPRGFRAVGQVVGANPVPLVIPCHRVLRNDGTLGGFGAPGGLYTKSRLLRLEGVTPVPARADSVFQSLFLPDAWDMAVSMLRRREPLFDALASKVTIVPIQQAFPGSPFAALAEAVVWQQLAGSAARVIFARVLNSYEELTADNVLDLGPAPLAKAGLSGAKRRTLMELALAFRDGQLPADVLYHSDAATRTRALSAIWGIGPWTIQMFEMFHLGLPDISSPSDLGIRKAITRLLSAEDLLSVDQCSTFLDRMRPLRTIACQALWNSVDSPRA